MFKWENDFINHSNSKVFWFVILCLLLKIHWLQKEHTVTLVLQKLAFKYLKHYIRTRSYLSLEMMHAQNWGFWGKMRYDYTLFGFQENSIRHHESYKESLHLRANIWTLNLIISSGHNVFSPSCFESSSWWNLTHKMCSVLCISMTIYTEITTNFPLRLWDLKG